MAGSARAADWPFVGRRAELQRVADAIGRADTTGLVLAGPPGVGKTRLARECLTVGERAGFSGTHVAATRAAASIPLGAFAPLMSEAQPTDKGRLDLIQEVVETLTTRAGGGPLMLAVDDAHLLDDASALVLHQLASSALGFVVTTQRSGDPVPDAVTALWKDFGAERIDVQPLGDAETEDLIRAVLDGPVDGATVHDLHEASQGNPLYLRELILGGLDAGLLREEEGLWRFTLALSAFPRLVDVVEARLADLDGDERDVLELVALGEPLPLDLLEPLAGYERIEILERRGLLTVVTGDGRPRVVLAHPLHGEVMRARIPKVRSMLLNRRLADAAIEGPATAPDDLIRLVLWQLDGGGSVDPRLVIDAARRAFFAYDAPLAERLARVSIDSGGGVTALQLLGETLLPQGRHREAEEVLAIAEENADSDEERALAAMARAEALLWGLGEDAEARAALTAVDRRLADGPWRDEVTGMRAVHEMLAGRPAVAVSMVKQILATGTGRPLVEATIAAAPALAIIGRCDEATALADRGWAEHVELGDLSHMTHPGIHVIARSLALGEAGQLAEAGATAQACYDAALTDRRRDGQAWAAMMLGRVALLKGRLGVAVHWFREGAAVYRDLGQPGPRRWCLAGIVLAAAMARDTARSTSALAELDATRSPMLMMEPDVERGRAWHALVTGEARIARDQFRRAADEARAQRAFALEAGALHDLARVGAPELVSDRLEELAGVVDGPLTAARARHAAALVGEDAGVLEHVSHEFEQLGALLLAAEAAAGAAGCHARRGQARAAQRWTQRAGALNRSCEGARTPALALTGDIVHLSPREREVALLAAEGLSNSEIAAQLYVSVRTVESHLHHAFTKLGVTSREELAATAEFIDTESVDADFQ